MLYLITNNSNRIKKKGTRGFSSYIAAETARGGGPPEPLVSNAESIFIPFSVLPPLGNHRK